MPLIALEVVLGFAVPVGWGVWQLMSLRRDRQRSANANVEAKNAATHARPTADAPTAPATSAANPACSDESS